MKKLFATTLMMLSCGIAYALPLGNPAEPSLLTWGVISPGYKINRCNPCCCYWFDYWSLKIGYYGDFVFNRHLELQSGLPTAMAGNDIQDTQIFTNAGYLALNLCNKVDIFGTFGASKITMRTNEASWSPLGVAEGRLHWDSRFSWSAGARGVLFQKNCFTLGFEGQYFQTRPDFNHYVSTASGLFNYFTDHNKMNYTEWQVGGGIAYSIACGCPDIRVVPYVSAKWSRVKFDTHEFSFIRTGTAERLTIRDMKNARHWGYAIGTTFALYSVIDFTVEGRWADESALYVNGTVRF